MPKNYFNSVSIYKAESRCSSRLLIVIKFQLKQIFHVYLRDVINNVPRILLRKTSTPLKVSRVPLKFFLVPQDYMLPLFPVIFWLCSMDPTAKYALFHRFIKLFLQLIHEVR
jgi:hypothetical protein